MITPILLCGGSGTRLWPLSRKSYPKQFVQLVGEETLFQASARRLSGEGYEKPIIVTNSDFRFIVVEQLLDMGVDPGTILIEPDRRNTAPAVLAAALWLSEQDPDALMLVAPSDHVVPDPTAFRAAVEVGPCGGARWQACHLRYQTDPPRDRLWLSGAGQQGLRWSGTSGAAPVR